MQDIWPAGTRIALGASVRDVRRLILGQTLRPVAAGIAIGIAIAAVVARVLQSVLFGVSPFDPAAYLGAPLVMIAVAALATWLPTRQALHADPLTTLRSDSVVPFGKNSLPVGNTQAAAELRAPRARPARPGSFNQSAFSRS